MEKKVTVQAIADALGLSRNTVSKALNNKGALAEDTRQKILDKAAEMGYRRVIYISEPSPAEKRRDKRACADHAEYALWLPFRNLCAEHFSGADEQKQLPAVHVSGKGYRNCLIKPSDRI